MRKQTNSVDSTKQKRTGFLEGAILRLRPDAPLWPANVAAELMTIQLKSTPDGTRDEIAAGLLPDSCRHLVRPMDVINYRRKFARALGVSQRATLRSRDVTIID